MSGDVPTYTETPVVIDRTDWKDVSLKIRFGTIGEILVIEVDTDDLTVQEEYSIRKLLAGSKS